MAYPANDSTNVADLSQIDLSSALDFMDRNKPRDVLFSINDLSAIPPVVSLRLDQALEKLTE